MELCCNLILNLYLPLQAKSNPRSLPLHCDVTNSIFIWLDSYTDCSLYPSFPLKTIGSTFATEIYKTNAYMLKLWLQSTILFMLACISVTLMWNAYNCRVGTTMSQYWLLSPCKHSYIYRKNMLQNRTGYLSDNLHIVLRLCLQEMLWASLRNDAQLRFSLHFNPLCISFCPLGSQLVAFQVSETINLGHK